MKKSFLIILLLYYSYCSIDGCTEADFSNCANINVGFKGFSCFQRISSYEDDDEGYDEEDEKGCAPLPTDKEAQQAFWKINDGFQLESNSAYGHSEDENDFFLSTGKKDFYGSGEVVEMSQNSLSNDVISKIKGQKTCAYNIIGRNLMSVGGDTYSDITDKTICFNSEKFDEMKNLVDCGYADISFTLGGQNYKMKTCFYVPNDHMPSNLNPYLMYYIKMLANNDILNAAFRMKAGKFDHRRRLQEDGITFSMEVENKYGRKVKYASDQSDLTILEAGQESPLEETSKNNAQKISNLLLIILIYLGLLL